MAEPTRFPDAGLDEALDEPSYRFIAATDGTHLAYCAHGEGPPLLFVRGWVSHLELMWADRAYRTYWTALARTLRVHRFDSRGNGLSDRNPERVDLESLLLDVDAVVDAAGLDRFVLYGASFGGVLATAYAALHPERVSHLIVCGGYARGADLFPTGSRDDFLATLRNVPAAGGLLLSRATSPEPDDQAFARADRIWRSVTPETAARLYGLGFDMDVTDLAPKIACPALVMHRRSARVMTVDLGRQLAALIPGAEFVTFEGKAHNPWEGDAGQTLGAIGRVLGLDVAPSGRDDRLPLTVLFTDMEGSTLLTQRLGDAAAQEVLRRHNGVIRQALVQHGGSEIKHTGDGIMASFRSTSRALECATAIQKGFAASNDERSGPPIRVRVGLNAGEPVREDRDLFGTAVQIARRACDAAEPGAIFVTPVVRELAAGHSFSFRDRGEHNLKGLDEPLHLYEVRWR
ncbi:MAG: adenylate/guanylate cyclase domain-containing protein [Dehalococcoidia bacterium]|nr:adenylate/guanylate cyclase domain-containing protein [Dehalococcoidia bacterium]